jgi:hypothetical protein
VSWGSWGCFGVLQFRPERASGVWLLESKFRYLPYENRQRRACFNATETAPPEPKSRAPGKGGFVGVVGQLGLLWGASVPTRTRERRLVTGIKIFVICLTKIVSGAPASTL